MIGDVWKWINVPRDKERGRVITSNPNSQFLRDWAVLAFRELPYNFTVTASFILACIECFFVLCIQQIHPKTPLSSCNLISCIIRMIAPKSPREGPGVGGDVCLSLRSSLDNWPWQNERPLRTGAQRGRRKSEPLQLRLKLPGENERRSQKRTSS